MNLRRKLQFVAMATVLCLASTASYATLITNGSFETGDLTGWTTTGNYNIVAQDSNAQSGSYDLAMGDTSGTYPYGTVAQTIATTAGQSYTLSYWFESDGNTSNYFDATWNGTLITGSALTNSPLSSWTQYVFNVTGTGNDTLLFHQQDVPGFLHLDNISLTPSTVPEPPTLALMGIGLIGLGVSRKRKNKKQLV